MPMWVNIYINGQIVNAQGYLFGAGSIQEMTIDEALVMTGETSPVVDDVTGNVVTGFVITGYLEKGLVGEKYEIIDEAGKQKPVKKARPARSTVEVKPEIVSSSGDLELSNSEEK